jgi:hypothetical protein|tara:strand:+ start:475 stop:645 length:171 start_codon:yes stop_codon:yes gene_type:complete
LYLAYTDPHYKARASVPLTEGLQAPISGLEILLLATFNEKAIDDLGFGATPIWIGK